MFETITGYLSASAMLLMGFLAFSIGGKPEKLGAGAFILGWLTTLTIHAFLPIQGVQWGMLVLDVVALTIFAALVWKSARTWPVWACALQLLVVASHVMLMAQIPTTRSAFYMVVDLTGYGIILAIIVGTLLYWQEQRAIQMTDLNDP